MVPCQSLLRGRAGARGRARPDFYIINSPPNWTHGALLLALRRQHVSLFPRSVNIPPGPVADAFTPAGRQRSCECRHWISGEPSGRASVYNSGPRPVGALSSRRGYITAAAIVGTQCGVAGASLSLRKAAGTTEKVLHSFARHPARACLLRRNADSIRWMLPAIADRRHVVRGRRLRREIARRRQAHGERARGGSHTSAAMRNAILPAYRRPLRLGSPLAAFSSESVLVICPVNGSPGPDAPPPPTA